MLPETVRLHEALSRAFLLHHGMCPRELGADGTLLVAVAPDAQLDALRDLQELYGHPVSTAAVSTAELEQLVERLCAFAEAESPAGSTRFPDSTTDVRDLANQPPVIRYVNMIVREAFDANASDIHIEAGPAGFVARLRIDGVLSAAPPPPAGMHSAVVSRIKLLAELDIAECRRPQDGRVRVRLDARELDLRVSTVPTMHGESVVLRLLERGGRPVGLDELGLPADLRERLADLTARPHGLVLATGPTGSGKTTTLYACLLRRDLANEKVVTVEDPIEYQLGEVTQVPVHRHAGVTFAGALRSILRQDPDVVMVGEMRDAETAELAVQAAMTGHLVFSTLHTNDAVSAVPRLVDLGVPPYLVASTLEAVLAQRLVRRVCEDCRAEYQPSAELVALAAGRPVSRMNLARGSGCRLCRGTGYRGRIGLFELYRITDADRDAIVNGSSRQHLRELARANGMRTMRQDGWSKIVTGLTTVEEVVRVTES